MAAYPGACAIIRRLYRTSCQKDFILTLQERWRTIQGCFWHHLRARLTECQLFFIPCALIRLWNIP
jgi:hypothetical protein